MSPITVLDGGMGHLIKGWGVSIPGLPYEQQFLAGCLAIHAAPETVSRAHAAYIDVGCDVITTNNFAATIHNLSKVSKESQWLEYCKVRLWQRPSPCWVTINTNLVLAGTGSRPIGTPDSRLQQPHSIGGRLSAAAARKVRRCHEVIQPMQAYCAACPWPGTQACKLGAPAPTLSILSSTDRELRLLFTARLQLSNHQPTRCSQLACTVH